ncbi:sigma-54-dependent transcriptional regulator [Sedimenticola selenatireducens]|uniref:Sigma-54-dependent Fis family transcriptional regulator n=1 Tax=Sedimenticola selenatireducens TaxID=191960 RepID=A0A557SKH8_9GAMM|nr:sigma-54 dependent transcriptional regulator [Sedimenticola selenatireducens]TVO77883.1 sigma-54-dependent Fis family transcriptional regulator [Sedimenticola selenatireducens]TVT65188.1 MAG: sigma-54-dependent Fis family transcriptional regulator [Sedimenticola selenatireducens]
MINHNDHSQTEYSDQPQIILVDDDAAVLKATSQWLRLAGMSVETFARAETALEQIATKSPDVIVSDIKMPGMDGLTLARRCADIDPDLPVILITAHGDIKMAVKAIRDGAYDFMEKPVEPELLTDRIQRAWEKRQLILENQKLKRIVDRGASLEHRLLGRSPVIRQLRQQIVQLAATPVDTVINGATGTGKELVAQCLHEWSPRSEGPFVAVNCGAIPDTLFESELFGHEKGAFTGASEKRIGKIEYAMGGTLFLDEIESMPLNFQIKLLRVLQERKLERLGSNKTIDLDIWIIAATKVNLESASAEGDFREDLYYRFNVAELFIPRLSERQQDIPLLFSHFAQKAAYQFERPYMPPTDDDLTSLIEYPWQGNVRQLKNIAERYVLGVGATRSIRSLLGGNDATINTPSSNGLNERVQQFEAQLIIQSLQKHKGNISEVMEDLTLPRRTLNNKMIQYEIKRKDYL